MCGVVYKMSFEWFEVGEKQRVKKKKKKKKEKKETCIWMKPNKIMGKIK